MSGSTSARRRRSARFLVAVLLCLSVEQLAFAAHACALQPAMTACGMAMPMRGPSRSRPPAALTCVAHCAAQPSTSGDLPALAAPARLDVALGLAAASAPDLRAMRPAPDLPAAARAPPRFRTLLFCSLLI